MKLFTKLISVFILAFINCILSAQPIFESSYGNSTFFGNSCALEQTSDGGYILTGTNKASSSHSTILLLKTDAAGDTLWTKEIEHTGSLSSYSIQLTSDGGYIICGSSVLSGYGKNIF